jgi:hypothetical protein
MASDARSINRRADKKHTISLVVMSKEPLFNSGCFFLAPSSANPPHKASAKLLMSSVRNAINEHLHITRAGPVSCSYPQVKYVLTDARGRSKSASSSSVTFRHHTYPRDHVHSDHEVLILATTNPSLFGHYQMSCRPPIRPYAWCTRNLLLSLWRYQSRELQRRNQGFQFANPSFIKQR